MDCPTCAMASPPGSVECTYCGARLVPFAASYAVPHPAYAAPHFPPSPVGGLARGLTVLLSLSAVGQAVQVALSLAGGPVGPMTALNLFVFIAIATVFLVWFYRVRKNAGLWGPQSRAQGWTIGAWFTPVVNLWFPVQILADVRRASSSQLPEHPEQTVVARLVAGWWTCWVAAWVTGYHNSTVHSTGPDGSMVEIHQAGFFIDSTAVSALCLGLGALLMERVIVRITAMQRARGVA